MLTNLQNRTEVRASLDRLAVERRKQLSASLEPIQPCGGYWTTNPYPKQAAFLSFLGRDALFGGAAGPGKSFALILGALQFVCVPGYAALLLRRTYPQLSGDGGLIEKSHAILDETDTRYSVSEKRWHFPSGATLAFGHLQYEADKLDYQSLEYQFVGFDELTQWPDANPYTYVGFSRVRGPDQSTRKKLKACPGCGMTLADVPWRTRGGTNPGGPGADWVYRRFVLPWEQWRDGLGQKPERIFVPARVTDNPGLNQAAYIESLNELTIIEREQLLHGDWSIRSSGGMFKRENFVIVDQMPVDARLCRYWDLAATVANESNPDPDWTVGVLLGEHEGRWYVADVRRQRSTPAEIEKLISQTAQLDRGRYGEIPIRMEQEPGASGKNTIAYYRQQVLVGFDFDGHLPGSDKVSRARPVSAAVENDNFRLVSGAWNADFIDEFEVFPPMSRSGHDDQVDATSGAMLTLSDNYRRKRRIRIIV